MNVVIAYDVENDNTRAQLGAMLSRYGIRLQRSVFECLIDDTTLADITARATATLKLDHDVFQIFPQCDTCRSERTHVGQARRQLDALYWIV